MKNFTYTIRYTILIIGFIFCINTFSRSKTISIVDLDEAFILENNTIKTNSILSGNIMDLSAYATNDCTTTINSFPYTQSFESGFGGWTQDNSDEFDWDRNMNSTTSYFTGPEEAKSGSWYVYTEASGNINHTTNLESPCIDLSTVSFPEVSFSYHMYGVDMGTLHVDISTDNGTSYTNVWSQAGQVQTANDDAWEDANLSLDAYAGQIIKLRFRGHIGSNFKSDMAIDDIHIQSIATGPEIKILGNGNTIIMNGDITPDFIDATNFGLVDKGSTNEHTFSIDNSEGTADLIISEITATNSEYFTIIATPFNTPILGGDSRTFSIAYSSSELGTKTSLVSVFSNDSNEPTYTFLIQGTTIQYFYDSDGDGILDPVDIDDDNDGITDTAEQQNCSNAGGNSVNYKFLFETFGVGTGRTTINSNNNTANTSYCYEDGIVDSNTTECPNQSSWILDHGEYSVVSKITGTEASDPENIHGDLAWYNGEDHTPNDIHGRMAVFSASDTPGVFYEATITGVLSNFPISYSFYALNIMSQSSFSGSDLPDITVQFLDLDENILSTYNTTPIGRCSESTTDNSCIQGAWQEFSTSVTLGDVNSFIVRFINNTPGGIGNNLAIDDISIIQTLCDTDNDGIADIFDLDSDNDGIPDVVEAGLGDLSEGTATLTNTSSWMDSNDNGMHDLAEGFSILNSDNDSTPNYLDLDSDNDTIFDVDESKTGNSADLSFENGDGDINGDGVGDGLDTDYVREKDADFDGVPELFADGILDIYDYNSGSTFETAFGNSNQGLGSTHFVLDSDSDGIPDYMDTTSNGNAYDISQTLYASLDTNNNGSIGGENYNTDIDKDGILDLFDTDDERFGSPRDLDRKLNLYFDGRNDYIEDSELLSGRTNATIMGWIKIDPTFVNGSAVIFGQENLKIVIEPSAGNYYIRAIANNIGAQNDLNSHPINSNQWYHVVAAFNGENEEITLYVNGENLSSTSGAGSFLDSNTFNFRIGKQADNTTEAYFKGFIDEVRVFNKTLSENEIQKMVYQEIENNYGVVRGRIVPKDIANFISTSYIDPLLWPSLIRYYRMDVFKGDIVDDLTTPEYDSGTGAKLYNAKLIDNQTAPMPFVTHSSGNLPDAIDSPSDGVHGQDAITYDWSIVKIKHNNVSFSGHQGHLALFIDELDATSTPIEYQVNDDSELNVSWYLELNGFIDLEGESQLVQGSESSLVVGNAGQIEKDQQGTKDLFTYNYWSSPVGFTATENPNNYSYKLNNNIFKDGTDSDSPTNISFIGGYNGSSGSPIGIAHYWIWKFGNLPSNDYSAWQHIRNTGTIKAGEGFTMKGIENTEGDLSLEQNYVFKGKPNNGDILTLNLNAGNDYLIGNPYASAIDADQFILDNGPEVDHITGIERNSESSPLINGTLYFWEHWGGSSHSSSEYQGGYGTYNFSGGVCAAAWGTIDPDVAEVGTGTKTPGRYIPVGQGFFVSGKRTGTINFNNGQRRFVKEENALSTYIRQEQNEQTTEEEFEDTRMKIRLGYNSINTIHRQLLITEDTRASLEYDWGFDGLLYQNQMDDMYWMLDSEKYIIQGIDDISENTVLPIGIHTSDPGLNNITIDILENVPNTLDIYVHDKELGIIHDLRIENYSIYLEAGSYLDRFEITFTNQVLGVEAIELANSLQVSYINTNESITIQNPELKSIKSVEMFNIIGQSIFKIDAVKTETNMVIKTNKLSIGTYIIKLHTEFGVVNKKVLVN